MPQKYVFCQATSRTQACQIIDRLKAARFSSNDIFALFGRQPLSCDFAQLKQVTAYEGAMAGSGSGGILGGALGWGAAMAFLAVPGVNPFTAADPTLVALIGAAVGAVAGGIVGRVMRLRISAREARRDSDRSEEGNILISVQTENSAEITHAEVIFAHAGAQGICTAAEIAVAEADLSSGRLTGHSSAHCVLPEVPSPLRPCADLRGLSVPGPHETPTP